MSTVGLGGDDDGSRQWSSPGSLADLAWQKAELSNAPRAFPIPVSQPSFHPGTWRSQDEEPPGKASLNCDFELDIRNPASDIPLHRYDWATLSRIARRRRRPWRQSIPGRVVRHSPCRHFAAVFPRPEHNSVCTIDAFADSQFQTFRGLRSRQSSSAPNYRNATMPPNHNAAPGRGGITTRACTSLPCSWSSP